MEKLCRQTASPDDKDQNSSDLPFNNHQFMKQQYKSSKNDLHNTSLITTTQESLELVYLKMIWNGFKILIHQLE